MKLWSALALAMTAVSPALGADPNLFQSFNYDRYNDGMTPNSNDLPGRLWVPSGPAPAGGYTLVTVFHGFDERGSVGYVDGSGVLPPKYNRSQVNSNIDNLFSAAQSRGFIFYAPQAWGGWGGQNYDMAANQMAKIMKTYDVDPTQIYVTGLSNGGRGTWDMATLYDDVFAAAVPICGQLYNEWGTTPASPAVLADLPIWAIHARDDNVVNVGASRQGVNLIRQAKGLPPIVFPNKNSYLPDYYTAGRREYDDDVLRYTEYENGPAGDPHNIWSTAYARADLYDWMFAQTKNYSQQLQLGETLRFDLGATVTDTEGGNYWNSTNYGLSATPGIVEAFAMTDEGRRTAVTLDVTNTFQGDSTSRLASLPAVGQDAWYVQNFGGADGLGEITLTGLTDGMFYDLELFGSSTNNGTVRYTVNGVEKTLNFRNNLSTTVTFEDVFAAMDGTLSIRVQAVGATYAYLNWFTLTAVPEPTTLVLLGPAMLLAVRRRQR